MRILFKSVLSNIEHQWVGGVKHSISKEIGGQVPVGPGKQLVSREWTLT